MPPKNKFTKEQIVDASFQIAKDEGIDHITIRKVAQKMGSSIAPIYVNFNDVEELKNEVINKIVELNIQMIKEESTGHPFFDLGKASLRFAREYPNLFSDFVMKPNRYLSNYDQEMQADLNHILKSDPSLSDFNDEELSIIFIKMRIFTTGISVMAANGLLAEHFSEDDLLQLLSSTGEDILIATKQKRETK